MKYTLTFILTLLFSNMFSQTFPTSNFKYTGPCSMARGVDSYDGKSNKVTSYECRSHIPESAIYRVIVIDYKVTIRDVATYYSSLKSQYAKQGKVSNSTVKGVQAVQVIENVVIEGVSLRQVSTAILYKNKSITLVLLTNSEKYSQLLQSFKNSISLI